MLKIAFDACYEHPLPEGHRFPMQKYKLLAEQLVYEGTVTEANFFSPGLPDDALFSVAHSSAYISKLNTLSLSPAEIRKTGFPLSESLITREKIIANGTWQCAKYALEYGISLNIAGGTHHAFSDRGEGFCILNDIAVAVTQLLQQHLATKILVIDLDVHQGNGTAAIFQNEARVFTFSMHGAHNYPAQKEYSDLDIGLPNETGDAEYLKILQATLPQLIEQERPDFVFYLSGVDVLKTDKLGKLALTIYGCKERDRVVLELCKKEKLPVTVSMGGGYSERLALIVEAHANTFRLAQQLFG